MEKMSLLEKHACEVKEPDYYYRIGMFAQMNHVTVKTLRFYEEQGLLLPAKIDESSGYRYYTMRQMEKLHQILGLKEAGFTLEDIKQLYLVEDKRSYLVKKKNDILTQIARLTTQLARLEKMIDKTDEKLEEIVRVKIVPEVICAIMHTQIASYDGLFDAMPRMGALMEEAGCECAIPEYCFTLYEEAGYKESDILVTTCQSVTQKKEDYKELEFHIFPQTKVVSIYHKGSYGEFSRTYQKILNYIEENGLTINGEIRECYIDGIWNKDSEDDWLSEIQIPIL